MSAREPLLWALLNRFEVLALDRYGRHAPALATDAKRAFVDELRRIVTPADDAALDGSSLAAPTAALLATLADAPPRRTLLGQGLVLEALGRSVYDLLAASPAAGPATRARAVAGRSASESVLLALPAVLTEQVGPAPFAAFAAESQDVLAALDPLGEALDEAFGDGLGLGFTEVIGAFSAELVTRCQRLGLPRREVLGHLASALMGLR